MNLVIGPILGAFNQYLSDLRKDNAYVQVGALSVSKEQLSKALDDVLQSAEIRQRITTDTAYRDRVRDAARGSSS